MKSVESCRAIILEALHHHLGDGRNLRKLHSLFLVATLGLGAVAVLYFSRPVRAATRTWTGAVNSNWSDPGNWDSGVPGGSDIALFNSGSNPATINVSISVDGIQITSGYTGTITQASGQTIDIGNSGFMQAGGVFAGGNSDIHQNGGSGDFTLSGGTFNSTSGTLLISHNFIHTAGTFNHNNGTVIFDTFFGGTINVPTSETFKNLTIDRNSAFGANHKVIAAGDTLIVKGSLLFNGGGLDGATGTVEAQGPVTVNTGFFGGDTTLTIKPNPLLPPPQPRTISFAAGASLLNVILNDPDVTLNATGAGTLSWQALTLQAGAVQEGAVDFDFGGAYNQSGGTFTGGSGNIRIFNNSLTMSGGVFTGGSGNIEVNTSVNQGDFNLSGGDFTSTSGTFTITHNLTHTTGLFHHNNGTVIFDTFFGGTINVPTSETFKNLTIDRNSAFGANHKVIAAGDTLIITGTLLLNGGGLDASGGGTVEAQGNMTVASAFLGGDANIAFTGAADQTYTNNGGPNPTGIWTVNKSGGALALLSNLTLQTSQPLNLTAGLFNQGASANVTLGSLTVGVSGAYRNFGTGDLTLGGNVSNSGAIELDGGGPTCGDADSILIRSSSPGAQRFWSGAGTFRLQDVDVQDQAGDAILTVFSGTNSGNNGANWSFAAGCAPTEITLVSFTATDYGDGRVHLAWQTGFETGNLGFNLYREESGKRVIINPSLIAGSALTTGTRTVLSAGQSYVWADTLAPDSPTRYWLEDLDLTGKSTWHGPVTVRYAKGKSPASAQSELLARIGWREAPLTNGPEATSVERAATRPRRSTERLALQAELAGKPAVKIAVNREGWTRVTAAELFAAGLARQVEARFLQMFVDGKEIPIAVSNNVDGRFDQSSFIEFYGLGLDTPSTDRHTYWLILGDSPGKRIQQSSSEGVSSSATSFTQTIERRDRTVYFSSLLNGEAENFFGAVLTSQPLEQTLNLAHLQQPTGLPATLDIHLQGVTAQVHRVLVQLNDAPLGFIEFDGQAAGHGRFQVPQALLKEGANTVRLTTQNGARDISLVERIRLSYQHRFTADGDFLKFTAPGSEPTTIGGFTTKAIRVFDVTDADLPQELLGKIGDAKTGGYAITVAASEAGSRTLMALTDEHLKQPSSIKANTPSALKTARGADFVIVSRREFFAALEPLRQAREEEGLKVLLVDIEDVYDEFNFGDKSPQALRDFLAYANAHWPVRPRYALFAGDASYDARNYLGFGDLDFVPTKLIDTALMETASDDWFADFNNDSVSDLAVGRLPMRTLAEATTLITKTLHGKESKAKPRALLIADANEGFDFEQASAQLRMILQAHMRVDELKRGQLDPTTAKAELLRALQEGRQVINYMGHGSVDLWRGNLLTAEEARALENDSLPLFVLMTCLNGYFHDAALDALAEALMKAERGGAIAVWASSAMTNPQQQTEMNQQLYRLMFEAKVTGMRLGETLNRTKLTIADPDIRRSWILLADPTLKLK